ncbi:hypothetical protein O7621_24230 [Solwaraspora sp. WMMD937]|uniref:hypothetical protein n=1 Tax=Solwaraspora sp. WMMD937 TaxID=3016090 RepID=UPI00249A8D91|nr:hypothetical protein [Solwaraspora sp. WMMD937]WFE20944.1 hypothetical protein O7621_24230 [Solwaraspora sp. WMMD937]
MRLTTFLFRTHSAPKVALLLLAVEMFNVFNRGMPWRGELVWSVDWAGTVLVLVGPVLAGAVAVDAGRYAKSGVDYLAAQPGPRSRVSILTWAAGVVPTMIAHLVAVGLILTISRPQSEISPWPSLLAVVAQLGGIAFYGAVGSACGRYLGSVAGAPAAVLLSVLLFWQFGTSPDRFSPLLFGRATSSVLGLQFNVVQILYQVVILILLTGVLLALPVRVIKGIRRPPHVITAVLLVAVIAAYVLTPLTSVNRFDRVAVAPSSCAGQEPVICVFPDHERFLPSAEAAISELYAGAASLGIRDLLPEKVQERVPGEGSAQDGNGRFQIPVAAFSGDKLSIDDLAIEMVVPHHCPALYGDVPPSMQFGEDLHRAAQTLVLAAVGQAGSGPWGGEVDPMSSNELREVLVNFQKCSL